MTRRQRLTRPRTIREALSDRGVAFDLFVDSAEGVRAPFDREVAARRATKALRRVLRAA